MEKTVPRVAFCPGPPPPARPAAPPVRGKPPARRRDHILPAEIGSLEQVVLAAGVGRELREAGMDHRAMEAFREILEHELPVGAHVVVDAAAGAKSLDVEPAEAARERRERPV